MRPSAATVRETEIIRCFKACGGMVGKRQNYSNSQVVVYRECCRERQKSGATPRILSRCKHSNC